MGIRIGINGFGRIGRAVLRLAQSLPDIEVVHINDLGDIDTLAHLFEYDSVQGTFSGQVQAQDNILTVEGREIHCSQEKDPGAIPWGERGVQLVLECTGLFRDRASCGKHLQDGVKKVILSAPGKDIDQTLVMGVNEKSYHPDKHHLVSNASCTTNCLAPMAKLLDEQFGIEYGYMTTIHSYTNDQVLLDGPHRDLRRARAAALNQVPTSTGAARAIALVLPQLEGKLEGYSIRVPTPNVSLVDLVIQAKNKAKADEVNALFKKAAHGSLKGILDYTDKPLVSSDFNGTTPSATIDGLSTGVVGGHLIKTLAWYDNETGFSQRMLDLARLIGQSIP